MQVYQKAKREEYGPQRKIWWREWAAKNRERLKAIHCKSRAKKRALVARDEVMPAVLERAEQGDVEMTVGQDPECEVPELQDALPAELGGPQAPAGAVTSRAEAG